MPTEHLDSSKEMSKYDPLALRRNYTTAWFARMSNTLLQYGPLMDEVKPIHQLEMVQRRAARWTLNRHHNTSSVKGMLEDLQWLTLEQRRTDCRLVLLFQIIHGLVQIPPTNYLQPSLNTTSRKNHNYTYQQCSTRTNYFKYSFFPYTTVIWNNLPYQLVNSPSVISFKAQVSKLQHIRE